MKPLNPKTYTLFVFYKFPESASSFQLQEPFVLSNSLKIGARINCISSLKSFADETWTSASTAFKLGKSVFVGSAYN